MRDAILSPFLQTSVKITYILFPHPPPPPPASAADTHISSMTSFKPALMTRYPTEHCTLLVLLLPTKFLSHYNLMPDPSPHFINTVLHYFAYIS
jgi:hypothetical protein